MLAATLIPLTGVAQQTATASTHRSPATIGYAANVVQALTLTTVTSGTATVTWPHAATATGYVVGRDGRDVSGYGEFVTTDPPGTTSRTFLHLLPGTTYTAHVQALPSGPRHEVTFTTPPMHQSPTSTEPQPGAPQPTATEEDATATPAPSTPPAPAPAPATSVGESDDPTPGWLSGASGPHAANGSFATWRGSPVEIGGTWIDHPAMYPLAPNTASCVDCGEWAGYNGPLDIGATPPKDDWQGWAAEAGGVHDDFWRQMLTTTRALRAGKGTTYIRPWYEYNGDWMHYAVYPGEERHFKAAYNRLATIAKAEYPEAVMVLGTSAGRGVNVADTYPDDTLVGALSIDFYNNWPFCTTNDCFLNKVNNGAGVNSLNKLVELAKAHGDPVIISEWSNDARPDAGGGGESPEFIRLWHAWLTANAGTGPGQVFAEIQFNLWPGEFELFNGQTTPTQPRTAHEYRRLF